MLEHYLTLDFKGTKYNEKICYVSVNFELLKCCL